MSRRFRSEENMHQLLPLLHQNAQQHQQLHAALDLLLLVLVQGPRQAFLPLLLHNSCSNRDSGQVLEAPASAGLRPGRALPLLPRLAQPV